MIFLMSLLIGAPIFLAPSCLSIYPLCHGESSFFLLLPLGFFVILFRLVTLFRVKAVLATIAIISVFFAYILLAIYKNSSYSIILYLSLFPIVVAPYFNSYYKKISRDEYLIFLYGAFVGSIFSLIAFVAAGGDYIIASTFIYGYLNYWNDYIIFLWSIGLLLFLDSNRDSRLVPWIFSFIFAFVWLAVLISASRASLVFLAFVTIGAYRYLPFRSLGVLIFSAIVFYLILVNDRFGGKLNDFSDGDPTSGRADLWLEAFHALSQSPYIGLSSLSISSWHSTVVDIVYFSGISSFFFLALIVVFLLKVFIRFGFSSQFLIIFGFIFGPFSFNVPLRQLFIWVSMLFLVFFLFRRRMVVGDV